jgi:putative transposase
MLPREGIMANRFSRLSRTLSDDSLARTFNTLHMRYSQHYNLKKNTRGHLWQGRFYSCILDERHLYAAVRYVENNPVRARIVRKPHRYKWSSAPAHVEGGTDPVLSDGLYLTDEIKDWSAYLMEKEDRTLIDDIRGCTRTGRPCGENSFVLKMENRLKRRLMALPRGRPQRKR